MKKVQIVIVILLLICAPIRCVAVSYARVGGMSEAPTMQMQSTSAWASQRNDVRTAGTQSGGFYTAASAVTGGVTTFDSYCPGEDGYGAGGARRAPGVPGMPTPVGDGWDVWIMLAVMAVGYAAWARRRKCRDSIPT